MNVPWLLLLFAQFLLVLEFYLPGGVMAIMAIVVYLSALYQAILLFAGWQLGLFCLTFLLLPLVVTRLVLWWMKRLAARNTLYLSTTQNGFRGAEFHEEFIGKRGVAISDLGPSGFALIEGKRVQVVSVFGYLEKGSHLVVKGGRGSYLMVQKEMDSEKKEGE